MDSMQSNRDVSSFDLRDEPSGRLCHKRQSKFHKTNRHEISKKKKSLTRSYSITLKRYLEKTRDDQLSRLEIARHLNRIDVHMDRGKRERARERNTHAQVSRISFSLSFSLSRARCRRCLSIEKWRNDWLNQADGHWSEWPKMNVHRWLSLPLCPPSRSTSFEKCLRDITKNWR